MLPLTIFSRDPRISRPLLSSTGKKPSTPGIFSDLKVPTAAFILVCEYTLFANLEFPLFSAVEAASKTHVAATPGKRSGSLKEDVKAWINGALHKVIIIINLGTNVCCISRCQKEDLMLELKKSKNVSPGE